MMTSQEKNHVENDCDPETAAPSEESNDGKSSPASSESLTKRTLYRSLAIVALIVVVAIVVVLAVALPADSTSPTASEGILSTLVPTPAPTGTALAPTPAPTGTALAPTPAPTETFYYETNMTAAQALIQEFANQDFYMVNVVKYREKAVYQDGRPTDMTGYEANALYGSFMLQEGLPSIGAEIVFSADVESIPITVDGIETEWDAVAVVHYPNASSFGAMSANPKYQEMNHHKKAGVFDTVILACTLNQGTVMDPPEEGSLEFPPTDTDPSLAMFHILDFAEFANYQEGDADADNTRTGQEAFQMYGNVAFPIVYPYGMRVAGTFAVQHILAGSPGFEEVRINTFPSHAAFDAAISDPVRSSATYHRTAGLEKSWSFQVSPFQINTMGGNGMTV